MTAANGGDKTVPLKHSKNPLRSFGQKPLDQFVGAHRGNATIHEFVKRRFLNNFTDRSDHL